MDFTDMNNLSIDTTQDGKPAPGQPPGFPQLSGVGFKIDKTRTFSTQRDYGSSGNEIMILTWYRNTGGLFTTPHWAEENNVSGRDVEWFIAGLHKNGPSNPNLPWNNAAIAGVETRSNDAPNTVTLTIEFACPGGNYRAIVSSFDHTVRR